MTPDWTKLAPNRPLAPGERTYVERETGEPDIAKWVLAGKDVVLVAGPVGIGKSTELAQAAYQIDQSRLTWLVRLDRLENMRTLTANKVRLALLRPLEREMQLATTPVPLSGLSARDRLLSMIREVTRRQAAKPCLLIDGLEKATEGAAKEAFDALREIQPLVSLVVVVPWRAVYGPEADSVLAPDEKLVVQRPVRGSDAPGIQFLKQMAKKRLELESVSGEFEKVLVASAHYSGGIPRTFLQLLADAATWARLVRSEEWPAFEDLMRAVKDQRDSFRRLLLPGDEKALREVNGTDGREMELDRKLRLLSHGMLLEREEEGRVVLRTPPMITSILEPAAQRGGITSV